MKINTEWLKSEFGINIPVNELAQKLTQIGFEVEGITREDSHAILELNVTPNRGDCMSHLGIAREIAATCEKVRIKKSKPKESGRDIKKLITVSVLDNKLCLRYCARIIEGVQISSSPDWLKKRLESVGIRSINNVVDVTNYVLMELGHPLHAFDLDKIKGKKIIVRTAKNGEKIKTLDGVERELTEENLVIADADEPIALAGVMGGANTEVTEETKNILLEAAIFLPESIQRTAKTHKIETESSIRFSRGVDYDGTINAIDKAALMIQSLAQGRIAKGIIDIKSERKRRFVIFNINKMSEFIGTEIEEKRAIKILRNLNFKLGKDKKGNIKVEVPSFRNDIREQADIYEEIARHYGYNQIPEIIPAEKLYRVSNPKPNTLEIIKSTLCNLGFFEVITYSFINPNFREKFMLPVDAGDVVLLNPLSVERSIMRPLILPGIIEVAEYNIYHGNPDLKLFEIGRTFTRKNGVTESEHLCGLLTGRAIRFWQEKERGYDFYDAKGAIEEIARSIQVQVEFKQGSMPFLLPSVSAEIYINGERVGFVGELLPKIKESFGIKDSCIVFEFAIDSLINHEITYPIYKPIPRLLAIERDISIIIKKSILSNDILTLIKSTSELITDAFVFDVYEGKNIPDDSRSIAIRIRIQPVERNLTDEEIDNIILNIVKILKDKYNAELRGKLT